MVVTVTEVEVTQITGKEAVAADVIIVEKQPTSLVTVLIETL